MHYSTNIDDLKQEIEGYDPTVENIWNIKHHKTKNPLTMFFVDLKQAPNNKEIYDITSLLRHRVKFEPPRQKREIPQCARCQSYGHTKALRPRCVKCLGDHATTLCPRKEKSDDVRCVPCEGNHPANYKGCTIYKGLLKTKYPPLRPKQYVNKANLQHQSTVRPNISYVQALKNLQQEPLVNHNQIIS
jgi:hypothetical protein